MSMNKMYRDYIFIIGCGHSGTTLLNKIIGNHMNVLGFNYETKLFLSDDQNTIKKLDEYEQKRKYREKKYIVEKTPVHVYCIDKMYKYIKNPKIIVMVRDGRDAICSLKKRYGSFKKAKNRWINDNFEWIRSKYCKKLGH